MKEPWKNNGLIRQNCRGVGQDQTTCSVQLSIFRRPSEGKKFYLARPFTRATKSRRGGGGSGMVLREKNENKTLSGAF